MELPDTYRRRLRRRASDQYGYVTTADAEQLDVPTVELRKLAGRGGLDHVAYGLYRFDDVPSTGWDDFMEAVLRVGRDAYLTHDAVPVLRDLGLGNPPRIRVGTPHRVRSRIPTTSRSCSSTWMAPTSRCTRGFPRRPLLAPCSTAGES